MKHHSIRSLRLATAGALAALTTYGVLLSPAAADDVTPPRPRPAAQPAPAPDRAATPAWGVNPAPGQDCPDGSRRTASLLGASIDGGSAAPFTTAMTVTTEGADRFLRHAGTGAAVAQILATPPVTTTAARLYLKFDVRGDFGAQDVVVTPRAGGTAWAVAPASQAQVAPTTWRTVRYDMTDGANEATLPQASPVQVLIARDAASRTTVDIDNLDVYQCSPPAVGEPGDFNGDGFADAAFVMRDGNLLFSAGTPTQSRALWRGGVGWASFTWIGSVGDSTGDGYTDLMARTATGDLVSYAGDGVRAFTDWRRIGTGWQGMRWILPVGDVNRDGRQDLIAGSGDGLMRFYSLRADGALEGGRVVGVGWGGFTHVVAIRSTSEPTRLYAIAPSGDMRSYPVTETGNMYGIGTKVGVGWAFPKVAGLGDFDDDGRGDVLAVGADGVAYVYPTLGEGRWKNRLTLQESIWHAARLVG